MNDEPAARSPITNIPYDYPVESPPRVRLMRDNDIAAVMAVERGAFEKGWPATAFERELTTNGMARYIVLELPDGNVIGFGGLWLMLDEAHVVTVAVLPHQRLHGYGRLLVHGLVTLAKSEGMQLATLEVRVSNPAARALYAHYGFYEVGLRKRYYSDNGEDAVIMTTEDLAGDSFTKRLERLAAELDAIMPGAVALMERELLG